MITVSEGPAEQAVLQRSMLDRGVAMELAATEYERFVAAVGDLSPDDWGKPTDCPAWDVRQLTCHVVGMAELAADQAEGNRQQGLACADATANDVDVVDALTAVQVRERQTWTPAEIVAGLLAVAPRAIRNRRRTPEGALSTVMPDPFELDGRQEWWTTGYLVDVILTRDVWMHRIDLCRATGRPMHLTTGHDGVIVADVVEEWARRHGAAFHLTLTGPGGGVFTAGPGVVGDALELDAVEFCRLVSGRGAATGLLETHVPF